IAGGSKRCNRYLVYVTTGPRGARSSTERSNARSDEQSAGDRTSARRTRREYCGSTGGRLRQTTATDLPDRSILGEARRLDADRDRLARCDFAGATGCHRGDEPVVEF